MWKRLRNLNYDQMRRYHKYAQFTMLCLLFGMFGIIFFFYRKEMELFSMLEPEDARDWKKVLFGARIGEIWPIGEEVLDRVDPLRVLETTTSYLASKTLRMINDYFLLGFKDAADDKRLLPT